jgi:hypothetical protein
MSFRFRRSNGGSGPTPSYSDLIAQRENPDLARPAFVYRPRRNRVMIVALGAAAVAILLVVVLLIMRPSAPTTIAPQVAQVTATRLNCRTAPSPGAEVLVVTLRTEKVELLEQNGSWRRVRARGKACWVSSEFLEPVVPGA